MAKKELIAKEVAEKEFERIVDALDLDMDTEGMIPEEIKETEATERKITRYIQRGYVTVDDAGIPTVHAKRSKDIKPIVFSNPTGDVMDAMDEAKTGKDFAKIKNSMASLTRVPAKYFSMMHLKDRQICQDVYMLFLG